MTVSNICSRATAWLLAIAILLGVSGCRTRSGENHSPVSDGNLISSAAEASPQITHTLASPDGSLILSLAWEDGGVSFSVADGAGETLLSPSAIGVRTEECDFSGGLTFVEQTAPTECDKIRENLSGKRRIVRNHYNEITWTFEKAEFLFDVTCRAYDDGFAYRFGIRSSDGSQRRLTVTEETGTFVLPDGASVTAQLVDDRSHLFNYENTYATRTAEKWGSGKRPAYLCFPALASWDNPEKRYMLLSEAVLFGDNYRGSLLRSSGSGTLTLDAAPKYDGKSPTEIETDFLSPWRFGIVGGLGDIVESEMTENLAPAPSADRDFSWVQPGVTAWTWLSEGFDGQRNLRVLRDMVNLASEMGWRYVILDEGWQPRSRQSGKVYEGYFSWFGELLRYADERNVGFIVWVKYADLDTPEEREILREWAAIGVKGIKADFFDSEDPRTLADFREIYEICADCGLLVNCHGAGKPTGERRTYPNVINREAVRGEEFGGFFVREAVNWAYTRAVVGPVDITPRLFPTAKGGALSAQLACCVLFESGMPCMADSAAHYRQFNGREFYAGLPASWDETRWLGGEVGQSVTLARRSGENWYAASLTLDARKDASLPLDFLEEGTTFRAVIYTDSGKSRRTVAIDERSVTREDTLRFDLGGQSGYVVRLSPVKE